MPYYPRVSAAPGGTFDAIVDAHWESAIWVSHDHGSAQDAQDAAEATARGLNLRDFESLVVAGFTEADLPDAEEAKALLDEQLREVEPLAEVKPAAKG